jgi:hypothetical protein
VVKGKKPNYKLRVISVQKGIVFIFANYLDKVLKRNYNIGILSFCPKADLPQL